MVCTIKFFWEAVVKTQLFYWTHHNNHTVTDKEWDITGNMLPALGHKKSFFFFPLQMYVPRKHSLGRTLMNALHCIQVGCLLKATRRIL